MSHSDIQYTKLRWFLAIISLALHVADILTDSLLAIKYFQEKEFIRMALTLVFVMAGQLVALSFSYAWFSDDMDDFLKNPEGKRKIAGLSKCKLIAIHLFGVGIFTRYYHLLKRGFRALWTTGDKKTVNEAEHHSLFCLATDLSMLKLFEAFLESVPQLLLQLYIVLGHNGGSVMQYLSMAFSFFNIAWALVDYRRCLRRSLPHITEMPSGLPTFIYLLYKLCTITSHILSYSLLLMLSSYTTVAMAIIWMLGTIWAYALKTNFCSSKWREFFYRAVIGVVLTFTFFNVKGQNTKVAMILYYILHSVINILAPTLLVLLKPETHTATFLVTVSGLITGGSLLGLLCLVCYYLFLHPTDDWRVSDEVDAPGKETGTTKRLRNFIQP